MLLQNYLKACAHFSYSPVTCHVVKGDKILLSLGIEIIGVDCVFRELGLVSWILMLIYINTGNHMTKEEEEAVRADSRRKRVKKWLSNARKQCLLC